MNDSGKEQDKLPLAVIGRYHGVKGEVTLHPFFDFQHEDLKDVRVTIHWPKRDYLETSIQSVQHQSKKVICKLACSNDIETARTLVHGKIIIDRNILTPLEDNEYFADDLIGFEVKTTEGLDIGQISEFVNYSGSSLMKVKGENEHLIPFVEEMVVEIDFETETVIVDPPTGLLEINEI